MNNTEWEVIYFKLSTTASDGKTDYLYANGNMQVPVVVSLKAKDKLTGKHYTLQDGDLSRIELVDYYGSNILSDGWSYTDQKNDLFSNRISSSAATVSLAGSINDFPDNIVGSTNESPDTKKFWVSTTKVENKNIAARIKQPDDTTVITNSSTYQSFVTLAGITSVDYTTDNVEFTQEHTNKGTYKIEFKKGILEGQLNQNWHQDNYFFSSTVHKFVKVDIHGYDISGFDDSGHPPDSRLKNCYAYDCALDKRNLKLSFIWDFGAETAKDAGLYLMKTWMNGDEFNLFKVYAFANIKINQKINALCLTRLAIDCEETRAGFWGSEWSNNNCGFTVYDMYGNTGKFSASFRTDPESDQNSITIHNAN